MRGAWIPLLMFVAACGRGDVPADDAGAGSLEEFPELALEMVHRIGSIDDPEQALTRLGDIMIGPRGGVFIAQPQQDQVRVYTAAAEFVGVIGRAGGGPGEFGSLASILFRGDTLLAVDTRAGRTTFFTVDGDVIRSEPTRQLSPARPLAPGGLRIGELSVFGSIEQRPGPDLTAVIRPNYGWPPIEPIPSSEVQTAERPVPIFRIDREGSVLDTLLWQDWSQSWRVVRHENEPVPIVCPQVWADHLLFDLIPDGSGVVAVERPRPSDLVQPSYSAHIVGRSGDTLRSASIPYAAVPLTEAGAVAEFQRMLEFYLEYDQSLPAPGDMVGYFEGSSCIPESYPPVSEVVAAQDGTVWIRREATRDELIPWDVLDAELEPMGRVMLPAGQTVAAAKGDILITTELDEYDVPYVIRYRVVR